MNGFNVFFPTRYLRDAYICRIFQIDKIRWNKNVLDLYIKGIKAIRLKGQHKKIPGYWINIQFNNQETNNLIKKNMDKVIPHFWLERYLFFPKKLMSRSKMEKLWFEKYELINESNASDAWKIFFKEAQQHFLEGRVDIARAALMCIYKKNPYFLKKYKRYYLFEDLAYYYEAKGQLHKSIGCLKNQATLQPDSLEAYLNMSSFLLLNGLNDEAIDICKRALQIDPNDGYLNNNLVVGYFNKGDFDKALEYGKNLVEKNPNISENWKLLGDIFYQLNQENLAIKCYQEGIKIASPGLDEIEEDIYYGLGLCYQQLGKFHEAIKYYKKLLKSDSENFSVLLSLSQLYGEGLKKYDKAMIYAKKVVRIFPQNGYAHHNLGLIYLYTGKLEKADWHLYRARRLIPEYQPVHDAIMELKKEKNKNTL